MKKILLFLFLSAVGNIIGQNSNNPTFKRHVIGVSMGFGFYSSSMITPTNYMEPLRSKAISYTFRIKPRFGIQLEYMKAKAFNVSADANTKHLFLSVKLTTKATKRFQGFFSPGVGLGFYDFYNENGISQGFTNKLIDFGGAAGLDIHFLKRIIFTYSFNYRVNMDIFPFFYNNIGLSVKI